MRQLFLVVLACLSFVVAQDVSAPEDHPLFSRYPGFEIKEYKQIEYDEAQVIVDDFNLSNNRAKTKTVEGKVTNITYLNDVNNRNLSLFQMYKNYENALKKQKAIILFSCKNEECFFNQPESTDGVFLGNWIHNNKSLFRGIFGDVKSEFGIITAEIPKENKAPITVCFVISLRTSDMTSYILESIIEPKDFDGDKIGIGSVSDVEKKMNSEGKIALEGIYFDFDKAIIKTESKDTLSVIGEYLNNNKIQSFYIVGHTDNKGTYKHNMNLSNKRAKAVEKYLKTKHKVSNKLQSIGIGPISPVMSNSTKEGREKNRRVELVLKK